MPAPRYRHTHLISKISILICFRPSSLWMGSQTIKAQASTSLCFLIFLVMSARSFNKKTTEAEDDTPPMTAANSLSSSRRDLAQPAGQTGVALFLAAAALQ